MSENSKMPGVGAKLPDTVPPSVINALSYMATGSDGDSREGAVLRAHIVSREALLAVAKDALRRIAADDLVSPATVARDTLAVLTRLEAK